MALPQVGGLVTSTKRQTQHVNYSYVKLLELAAFKTIFSLNTSQPTHRLHVHLPSLLPDASHDIKVMLPTDVWPSAAPLTPAKSPDTSAAGIVARDSQTDNLFTHVISKHTDNMLAPFAALSDDFARRFAQGLTSIMREGLAVSPWAACSIPSSLAPSIVTLSPTTPVACPFKSVLGDRPQTSASNIANPPLPRTSSPQATDTTHVQTEEGEIPAGPGYATSGVIIASPAQTNTQTDTPQQTTPATQHATIGVVAAVPSQDSASANGQQRHQTAGAAQPGNGGAQCSQTEQLGCDDFMTSLLRLLPPTVRTEVQLRLIHHLQKG